MAQSKQYNFDELIKREGTNSVKYDLRGAYFGKENIIPMWVADMDFRSPDFVVEAIKERTNHEVYGYSVKPDSFYTSIIRWLKERHNWKVKKEWIVFSPGIVPALNMAILAYTSPGDEVVVQPPVYFPFFSAVTNHDRNLVKNNLFLKEGKYFIDFQDLKNKITRHTRLFLFCSPHNPVGRVWNKQELEKIGCLCVENNITLIADEIHHDLVYPAHNHILMASLSDEIANHTVTCIAPSKTFNLAGLASSALIIPNRELRTAYMKILDDIHVGMGNIFGVTAMEAAYTYGADWVDQLMQYLKSNLDLMTDYFEKFIPEINVIQPEATYLVWLDCRELKMNDKELKNFFISKVKIGLNDGATFGEPGKGFQRMNIACPRATLIESLRRIESAVKKYIR